MWLLLLACGPSTLGEATRLADIQRLIDGGALEGQTELVLRDRGLGPELAEAVAAAPNDLQVLDLSGNLIGPRGATALSSMSGLRELRLGPGRAYVDGNGIQDAGAQALAAGSMDALETLDLTKNRLGPDAGAALASGLPSLQKLVVDSNALGDEGARSLSARPLDTLHLGWNGVGDTGAQALGQGQFRTLLLASNDIGPEGAAALVDVRGLETLYLSGNDPGDAAAALGEALGDGLRLE